jgi:hypothetical protein
MFIGMTVGGYIGWWAGDCFGFGLMGDFFVSSIGSIAGIYIAWRIMTKFF